VRGGSSVGDGFPDEFGDVDHQIGTVPVRVVRGAYLAHTHAHHVVEAAVPVVVAEVQDAADDLPPSGWIGAAISVQLDDDGGAVVGIDSGAEVGPERSGCGPALGEVHAAEVTTDQALASAFGEEQMLLPPAFEADHPALRIAKTNSIHRLEPQRLLPPLADHR